MVVIFALSSIAQERQLKEGNQFSQSELQAASKNESSFDKGLTAEWLLALRTQDTSQDAVRVFEQAVFTRTKTKTPGWWLRRLTRFSEGLAFTPEKLLSTKLKVSRRIARLGSEVVLLPKSFEDCYEVFGSEFAEFRVITAVSKQQGILPVLVSHKTANVRVQQDLTEVPPSIWNPALAVRTPLGFPAKSLPDPAVEFLQCGKKLVIFIDVGCMPSISIFDCESGQCELSFVAIHPGEAAFMNYEAKDLRPADAGG